MDQKAIIIAIVALIIGGALGYTMGMKNASADTEKMMIEQNAPEGSMNNDQDSMMEDGSAAGDDQYMDSSADDTMMEEKTDDAMMEETGTMMDATGTMMEK